MSIEQALGDPIFLRYAILAGGLLAVAGMILLILRFALRKPLESVWLTYKSWLVMAPAALAVVLLGREAVIVGVTLLGIFGFKEFARATGLYRNWWMTGAVYLAIAAVGMATLVDDPFLHRPGWWGLFLALPAFAIGLFLLIPILRNRVEGQLQLIALAIVGFLYIGWMFGHAGFLANSHLPYGYLLFLLFACELNDVAAFTFGRLFGRHPLRSAISPRKTWEGALGALAVSMALPWALWFSFPPDFGTGPKLLTGLIVGVGGQLGDLSISVIKRDLGIKDMGAAIPGHGGILDRIDSLIYVAPLFVHMLQYTRGIW